MYLKMQKTLSENGPDFLKMERTLDIICNDVHRGGYDFITFSDELTSLLENE